jgi:hypothetical protein
MKAAKCSKIPLFLPLKLGFPIFHNSWKYRRIWRERTLISQLVPA